MLAFCLALAAAFSLQDVPPRPTTMRAWRVDGPIVVDGRLNEAAWRQAEPGSDFRQWEPEEGQPATERTEVRVLYDNGSIYVGVRLRDSQPDQIVRRLSRRDDNADADRVTIYLDGLHDRLTGAAFEVSAGGSQRDSIISNDTNLDSSWDAVWESAVSVDAEGWSAELRIPLSQLRFRRIEQQTWGINVERFIYRKNERDWLVLVPRRENGLASRMADLTGLDAIQPRRALEIVPYTAGRAEFLSSVGAGNPFHDGTRASGAVGMDIKYQLRPDVVLNATVNPDFGQVEIDPAVVNLTAFETFFPEKRPFFIEGAQIFTNFGNLGANNHWGFNRSEPSLLYSRRIGRAPQGTVGGDFVDIPSGTTILAAAKITGKTTGGWSFGLLDAVTGRETARAFALGTESRAEVEPRTNYVAGRLLKEFGNGRSGIGGLVTSANRGLGDAALQNALVGRAQVAGLDGYYFFDRSRVWVVHGRLAMSEVAGSMAAVERLQRAPQRYFQRPDTPERFDPWRTSLRGWTGSVNLNRNQGGWSVNAALWGVSPGFESGDVGFHYNGDVWGQHAVFQWRQIEPDRFTRDRNISVAKFWVWDYGGAQLSDGLMSFANLTLPTTGDWGGEWDSSAEGKMIA